MDIVHVAHKPSHDTRLDKQPSRRQEGRDDPNKTFVNCEVLYISRRVWVSRMTPRHIEHEPEATGCVQILRICGVGLKLVPDAVGIHADVAVLLGQTPLAPDPFEKFLLSDQESGSSQEELNHPELDTSEMDLGAIGEEGSSSAEIYREVLCHDSIRVDGALNPAKCSPQASYQFFDAKRLHHIVVGTSIERRNDGRFVCIVGHDQDWDVGLRSQLTYQGPGIHWSRINQKGFTLMSPKACNGLIDGLNGRDVVATEFERGCLYSSRPWIGLHQNDRQLVQPPISVTKS